MLHGVKGGVLQKSDGTVLSVSVGPDASVTPGSERWSFVAKEFFANYKRLRAQTPTISGTKPKDYFFDGSIGIYQKDVRRCRERPSGRSRSSRRTTSSTARS